MVNHPPSGDIDALAADDHRRVPDALRVVFDRRVSVGGNNRPAVPAAGVGVGAVHRHVVEEDHVAALHLDGHLTVPWYFNIHEAHKEIDELAKIVRSNFGETLELFVHTDGCLHFQCHVCTKEDCNVRQHPFKNSVEWTLDNALQNENHSLKDVEE